MPTTSARATFLFAATSSPSPDTLKVGDLMSAIILRQVRLKTSISAMPNIAPTSSGVRRCPPASLV